MAEKKGMPGWAIGCLAVIGGIFALVVLGSLVGSGGDSGSSSSSSTGSSTSSRAASSPPRNQPTEITFGEIYSQFSAGGNLSDLQKDAKWDEYKGKCVEWNGQLAHLDEALFGGIDIGFKHRRTTFTYDILVSAPSRMKDELLTWNMGQFYTYRATLKTYPGVILPMTADWGCDD